MLSTSSLIVLYHPLSSATVISTYLTSAPISELVKDIGIVHLFNLFSSPPGPNHQISLTVGVPLCATTVFLTNSLVEYATITVGSTSFVSV